MLLFLLFMFCVVEHSVETDEISCNGLLFDHVYYDREVLLENLGRPYNLVMHKFSATLFFSHTVQKGTEVDFEIMTYDLNKNITSVVEGVPGGYAIAYDPGNDDIYVGGHDGIYKYNFLTKSAEFFAEEGKSIWGLFIRKNFYYIEYPTQKLHVYIDDKFVQVAEAVNIEVDNFFTTKRFDVYFSNKTALYKVDRISRSPLMLNDDIVVRQIIEDSFGDIYIGGNSGIYVEDKPYNRIRKVANIDNLFGMTFDENDHIIYSDKNAIYRLIPSNNSNACKSLLPPDIENTRQGFEAI
ncbi:unnamed protein product [Euphydryas editha]|uniref:Ommochrome-binding protein n=1 Tax=Euphydryas editha TaxID=104508 RepID=A0AAU9UBQ2_EUPED|nr:unnamed protein product [Euphydryas editha]